jgi:glycosyltransferase A (GT-A) superfamily protein (DUF2064 family)
MSISFAVRLIVFARVPRLGAVKTRLAAGIGEEAALAAYRVLMAHALSTGASCTGFNERILQISGEDKAGECRELAARWGYRVCAQEGIDLGERMARAIGVEDEPLDASVDTACARIAGTSIGTSCRRSGAAIVIGSDCPVLSAADLDAGVDALRRHDVVFAPAEDGGYALVGCARPGLPIFQGIAWGGPSVLEQSRRRARQAGLSVKLLRRVWDVDTADDWERWQRHQALSRDSLS